MMDTRTIQSMYRRPCVGGDEVDAFSRTGKLVLTWNHGDRAKIKTRARRRDRRTVRQLLHAGIEV